MIKSCKKDLDYDYQQFMQYHYCLEVSFAYKQSDCADEEMRYKDNNYYNKQREISYQYKPQLPMLTKYGINLRSKIIGIVILNYYSLDYPFKHGYIR